MTVPLIIIALLVLLLIGFRAHNKTWHSEIDAQTIRAFKKDFPGQCIMCSFYRFGVRNGLVKQNEKPGPHWCPEEENAKDSKTTT